MSESLSTLTLTLLFNHFAGVQEVKVFVKEENHFTWRREAAKASWELLSRVLNWAQMLRASLAALRLSMASWATLRFHSGVMAGGFTNVILWIIYKRDRERSCKSFLLPQFPRATKQRIRQRSIQKSTVTGCTVDILEAPTCLICSQTNLVTEDPE